MKYDRAWPQINEEAKLLPKNYIEKKKSLVTVDQILKETFDDATIENNVEEKNIIKKPKKIQKVLLKKQEQNHNFKSTDPFNDIKNVWIAFLIIFLLGLYAFNTIFFRLGILETLMSRQSNVSTL